jgi:DNA replication initiation complex subunit (GINS family)
VDASVVVGAVARNDLVVSSDAGDLVRIARAVGARLDVHRL